MTSPAAIRSHDTVDRAGADAATGKTATVLIAAITVLAIIMRFYRLGDWNYQATEMFTLRDSLRPTLTNPRPLIYLLNHYGVGSFLPLDEFGLRLLPAVFGVLAIPAVYFMGRRLVGTPAALCAAFLLALSPLHILYSQLGRYWSLVFLFCSIYPYAFYLGIKEGSRRWLVIGCVSAVLAALAHPVAFVLLGSIALWLAPDLRREHLRSLWGRKAVRWGLAVVVVLAGIALVRFVDLLQGWISMHDKNPGYGQFLRPGRLAPGMKQVMYLVGFAESLTIPLVLSAVGGIVWLWQQGDRSLGRFLACLAGFHIGFMTLVSMRTSVSHYYLLPAVPALFVAAGVFIDRLFRLDVPWRPRWLLPALMLTVYVAAAAPTLVSDMRDGRRYDFRTSARWIVPRLGPADIVFSDQPMVMAHYLPEHPVRHLLLNVDLLKGAMGELRQAGARGALWIVAPAPSHARRPTLKQGGMIEWIYDNCRLRNTVGVGRFDFRQNYLSIFRCPSAAEPPGQAETAMLRSSPLRESTSR